MTDTIPLGMTAPSGVYRRRRAHLAAALERPLVIFAGHAPSRTYEANTWPFRAGSTYLYFGGPPMEHAAWLIEPGSDGDNGCSLFRPVGSMESTVWEGPGWPDDALAEAAGLRRDGLIESGMLEAALSRRGANAVYPQCVRTVKQVQDLGLSWPGRDQVVPLIEMRLVKDEHERSAMRQAAAVTVDAHRAAMKATRPGHREADVAAAFMQVLFAQECAPAYNPIITIHGEVLHGRGYSSALQAGTLVLCDAAAEEPTGYACDVTRTWPVSGEWTPLARHLYDTVRRAEREAIAACVPGRRFRDVHDLAARVLCEGLVEAELLRGDPDELAGRYAHALFFTHGVGHLIGLDAHDLEDFGDLAGYASGRTRRPEFGNKYLRLDRDLRAGLTLTVEPGLYFVPALWEQDDLIRPFADVVNRSKVDAVLSASFGGIRVEDTVCVGADGDRVILTDALPTAADEIAAGVGR